MSVSPNEPKNHTTIKWILQSTPPHRQREFTGEITDVSFLSKSKM